MKLTLRIWRQPDRHHPGSYERHALDRTSPRTCRCWKPSISSMNS